MNEENIYHGSPFRGQSGPPVANGEEGRLSPLNLARMALHRWKVIFLCVLLGALAGLLYIQYATPIYEARAEMEMSVRQPKVIRSNVVIDDSSLSRDEGVVFYTRFAKFKSPAMEKLATEEYFKRYPEDESSNLEVGVSREILALLIRNAEWSKDPKANIVTVSYSSPSPEFAAKLVNVLSYCAGLLMMQENKAQSDKAVEWLVVQVEEKRESLDEVERRLADLREELHLDFLQQRKSVLDQSLGSVSAERETLISTLASRKTVYAYVKQLQGTDANLEVLPPGLPKEEQLNELIQNWKAAREARSAVAGRYTELHPEYRRAAEAESRARAQLDQFIDLSKKAVESEIELLGNQVDQVTKRIDDIRSESLDLEQQIVSGTRQLERLQSEREVANASYQAVLKRVEEARLDADESMAFTKVIKDAEVPNVPVSPSKPRAMVMSAFLGGFIGVVIALIIALMQDNINSINDLRSLKLHVLGVIPSQKKMDSRGELATIGLRDRFNQIVEIFAGMNALFSADRFRGQSKVLAMCSVMPGEGKTICACNLAISSALNGVRTLLIDCDLRRPQISNIFGFDENHPSLLEWMNNSEGALDHEHLISHSVIDHLDVISSRPFTDINPGELLGRSRLSDLLAWARENYDRVVIDTPPMGPVGDALVLADRADSVILVCRVGKTRRRLLKYAMGRLQEVDANILGCIANDVSYSLAGMFSGAEGYGYGHGYGGYKAYTQN